MNAKVLRRHEVDCGETLPAKLDGYELSIKPRVNLEKKGGCTVYGGLAFITHRDISRLYSNLKTDFGITYYPFPVSAQLPDGSQKIALCYIAFDIPQEKANPKYINELAECAKEMNAPEPYIQRIKSFA